MMKPVVAVALVFLLAGTASAATFEDGLELKKAGKLPEAEAVFAAVVKERPDDVKALEQWATVLGWLGRHEESIAAWQRAVALRPEDPDDNMGLARVQYWHGDYPAAKKRMDGVLARDPRNPDALILAGDICNAAHDLDCARTRYLDAERIAPSPELTKKLAGTAAPPAWRADAGGQLDNYDNTRGVEGSFFGQLSWKMAQPFVLSGGYEQLHQFGVIDHRLNLGGYLVPVSPLLVYAKVAISPTANTVANWELVGGIDAHLAGPFTLQVNERHLDFDDQGVTIAGGGLRVDTGRWSFSAQGGFVYSTVFATQGYVTGKVEYAINEDVHVYAAGAYGGQTLKDATGMTFLETATDAAAGVTWNIDATWGLRLDYSFEKFGSSFVRNSLGSAATVRF